MGKTVEDLIEELLAENRQLNHNLTETQNRCTDLLGKARAWRIRITELGGEDPGPP